MYEKIVPRYPGCYLDVTQFNRIKKNCPACRGRDCTGDVTFTQCPGKKEAKKEGKWKQCCCSMMMMGDRNLQCCRYQGCIKPCRRWIINDIILSSGIVYWFMSRPWSYRDEHVVSSFIQGLACRINRPGNKKFRTRGHFQSAIKNWLHTRGHSRIYGSQLARGPRLFPGLLINLHYWNCTNDW